MIITKHKSMKTIKQVIGINVSKDTFHVCLGSIDEAQCVKILKQSSFTNNEKGFKQLLSWKHKNFEPDLPLCYVMEATGVYYENLAYFYPKTKRVYRFFFPISPRALPKALT